MPTAPPSPSLLSGWQVVMIFVSTIAFGSVVILTSFWMIARDEKLMMIAARGANPYLRFVTVILVVWAVAMLSIENRMTEGPSAILGMICGYVFGSGKPAAAAVEADHATPRPIGTPEP